MTSTSWSVAGSYFEVCNCDAICPCRWQGGRKVTTGSTYGVCDFALSWHIREGRFDDVRLDGLAAVLAGSYRDDEAGKPWRVCIYVDARADAAQQRALADIFTGRAGGTAYRNYAKAIAEVYAVRPATIELDHRRRRWSIRADQYVTVRASTPVDSELAVTCGIPGHNQPGEEVRADLMRLEDPPLRTEVHGRCGFAGNFDYRSDQ
jgi:hypothetical protein